MREEISEHDGAKAWAQLEYQKHVVAASMPALDGDEGCAADRAEFSPGLGIGCRELPLHPQLLLEDYHDRQKFQTSTTAHEFRRRFIVDSPKPVLEPPVKGLPCQSSPHNVCRLQIGVGQLNKFDLIEKSLSGLVSSHTSEEALSAELMWCITWPERHAGGEVLVQRTIATLGSPTFKPQVQVWQRGFVCSEEMASLGNDGGCPDVPFFTCLASRPARLCPDIAVLDSCTGDDLASQMLAAEWVEAVPLEYDVQKDLRMARVSGVGQPVVLYVVGQQKPYRPPASKSGRSRGLGLPTGSLFQPGSRGRGRGRGRGGAAAGRARGGGRARGLAEEEVAAAPVDDEQRFDLEGELAGVIGEVIVDDDGAAVSSSSGGDDDFIELAAFAVEATAVPAGDWPACPTEAEDASVVQAADVAIACLEEDSGGRPSAKSAAPSIASFAEGAARSALLAEPAPAAMASSSGSSEPPLPPPLPPPADDEPDAVAVPPDAMTGITWQYPEDGGYVFRTGKAIGRITTWNKSMSLKCWMHGCAHAVSGKVPLLTCVKWLASGVPVPDSTPEKDKKAVKASLKAAHVGMRKPAVSSDST